MRKLATKEYCTGCTACASVCPRACITMVADENGFLCPVIDAESCIECGLCEKTCPIITPVKMVENEPKAFAAYSTDDIVRMESSSGGVFTEIAKAVLAEGGAVFGAAYNEYFDVVHICVDSEAELAKLRGAKYAQSDLQGIFTDVKAKLDAGQQVLFSGTPCQVAGLKAFLRKDYPNLLTVDFVCHGIPSPMVWAEYVKSKKTIKNSKPVRINQRSKDTGWSRYSYSCLIEYDDGTRYSEQNYDDLYIKLFCNDYISRESCGTCNFKGYDRKSDITIGDFWGIWDIDPQMDDNKGTSVVLIQSEKGKSLWNEIGDRITFKEVSLEQASQQNLSMLNASKAKPNRNAVLDEIREGHIGECEKLFIQPKPSVMNRIKGKIKRLIHM